MKAQVGVIAGVLPGFVTRIHKDSVRRWNLWFPSAGVFAKVLAGRATGTQITFPDVTKATLVSQLTYAAPAWRLEWFFLSETDTNRLQSVIKKAKRFGYLPSSFCNIGELSADADKKLLLSVRVCVTIHIMFCINYYPQSKLPVITPEPDLTILPSPATLPTLAVKTS